MLSVFNFPTPRTGGCVPCFTTIHHESNGTKAGNMLNKPAMASTGNVLECVVDCLMGNCVKVRMGCAFKIPMSMKAWPCEGQAQSVPKVVHCTFPIDHWNPFFAVNCALLGVALLVFEGTPVGHSFGVADNVERGELVKHIPWVFVLVSMHVNGAEWQGGVHRED